MKIANLNATFERKILFFISKAAGRGTGIWRNCYKWLLVKLISSLTPPSLIERGLLIGRFIFVLFWTTLQQNCNWSEILGMTLCLGFQCIQRRTLLCWEASRGSGREVAYSWSCSNKWLSWGTPTPPSKVSALNHHCMPSRQCPWAMRQH